MEIPPTDVLQDCRDVLAFITRFSVAAINEISAGANKSLRLRLTIKVIDTLRISFRMRHPAVRFGVANFDSRPTRRALLGRSEIFNFLRSIILFFHLDSSVPLHC